MATITTNNETLYAVYNTDGSLKGFQENNFNTVAKTNSSQIILGSNNQLTGNYSTVIGGSGNKIMFASHSSILAGANATITGLNGATILADAQNRNHYADNDHALTIDYSNGIYLKNGSSINAPNGPVNSATDGIFCKIAPNPYFIVQSRIAGPAYDNSLSAQNYFPNKSTKIEINTNNWVKNASFPKERIDSISSISIGPEGIALSGVNTNLQNSFPNQDPGPATASLILNSNITLETAKDGNDINLISDNNINLTPNGDLTLNTTYGSVNFNTPAGNITLSATTINLQTINPPTSSTSPGISGQISFDDNYFYRHNGKNWTRTSMGIW